MTTKRSGLIQATSKKNFDSELDETVENVSRPKVNRIVELCDKWCRLEIKSGVRIKIDLSDFKEVSQHVWHLAKAKTRIGFVVITNLKTGHHNYRKVSLQRLLMNPAAGELSSIRNENEPYDFRRSNLFIQTRQSQARRFPKKGSSNTSVYKGVSFRKERHQWAAMIHTGQKHVLIGYFESEKQAALAYNEAAKLYFGADGFENEINL